MRIKVYSAILKRVGCSKFVPGYVKEETTIDIKLQIGKNTPTTSCNILLLNAKLLIERVYIIRERNHD